jgi:multisubunit Na+/H+ antiporter MnhB subunit
MLHVFDELFSSLFLPLLFPFCEMLHVFDELFFPFFLFFVCFEGLVLGKVQRGRGIE